MSELLQVPVAGLCAQRYYGRLPGSLGVRIGRHVRFRESDIERFLDERRDVSVEQS